MEHDERGPIYVRLKRACAMSRAADAMREEFRIRLNAAEKGPLSKEDREEIVKQSWSKMWAIFEPIVERIELLQKNRRKAEERLKGMKEPDPTFEGYTGDLDDIVDPNYKETDAGKRLRDAFVWVGDHFRRITTDFPDGSTVMDFSKARTRPPTDLAVQIAEEYARCPPGSRRELFSKLAMFAVKSHTPKEESETADTSEADAYLAALEEPPPCNGPTT